MTPDLAVIFDLDGLLADTEPVWTEAARVLLERRGRVYDPRLKQRTLGHHPLEVARIFIEEYRLAEEPTALLDERISILLELYQRGVQPLPGATELVRALEQRSTPMAVASSSPSAVIVEVLARIGLQGSLPVRVGSDLVARGKPSPDLFLLAAHRLSVDPACCVVLEDSPAGIEAADAAGMCCLAISSVALPEPARARASLVLSSLLQVTPDLLHQALLARRPPVLSP